MSNITNYLNKVKTAIYGKEVRGAIHDAIKQVYDDASVEHDNANMEVKLARGTHNTLNDRLDNVDEIQAQTNAQLSEIDNERQYISVLNFGAKGDGVTDDSPSFQMALDYANANGVGVLIPNKPFYIKNPLILKNQGTYHIKGLNTTMNDGTNTNSKSKLIPDSILFKGELDNDNTTVYLSLIDIRIMPKTAEDGYTKDGTYIFYNLNLFGLVLKRVTVRYIDVVSQGYISKASVISECRFSFIKTAFLKGNQFNGAFMADSQITNSYITGAYPCSLFIGSCVNSTVSNCFFDYFKYMHNCDSKMSNHFNFKDNTIGIFYRWFNDDICRGNVNIERNKIDNVSTNSLIQASTTNFVFIDEEMRSGVAGPFVQCSFLENINESSTDKCKIHGNRFTESDNIFTKSNGYMQVSIKDNAYSEIKGQTYDLSFRDTTGGTNKFGEFYCDALDNQVVAQLPTIRSGNNVYVFEGQRCIVDGIEYTVTNDKWVATSYLNYYQTNEMVVGKYLGKDLYRKVITGTLELLTTGFKQISIPEADNLFIDLTHSYFGDERLTFNSFNKTGVTERCVALSTFNNNKILMYSINQSATYQCNYSITIEYTKIH